MQINKTKIYIITANVLFVVFSAAFFYRMFICCEKDGVSVFNISAAANETVFEESVPTVSSNEPEKKTESVAVDSSSVVLGKILDKYISPYTADTAYKNIYLKNSTDLDIDLKSLFESDLSFKLEKTEKPQVLILNTHATETFMLADKEFYTDKDNPRTTDNTYNMIALGDIVADKLNSAGIVTLHDKTLHDYPSYNESYYRAADTICSYLEKYPSIKIVIDLHRDSVTTAENDKVKLTKEIGGKKAAQVMLVMGSQSGATTNFPNYKENLKLAAKIQSKIESMYSGLARSICLMPKNYNESLSPGSVLIEIGTDGNTFEEACYSAELLGNALAKLFKEL